MEIETENEKKLYNIIKSIAEELGCKFKPGFNFDPYEIQSLVIKDFHISRIIEERDRKVLKRLKRENVTFAQTQFLFAERMKGYS